MAAWGRAMGVILFGFGAGYGKLWTASTVSNLGDGVTLVAAPLLAASLTWAASGIYATLAASALVLLSNRAVSEALAAAEL